MLRPWPVLALSVLSIGCYASFDPGIEPACDEEMIVLCALQGVWVFPSTACGMDHTTALGLCAASRAVLATAPRELGGSDTVVEGTWSSVVSPNLVAVELPDAELALQWSEADDTLSWRAAPDGCIEPTAYRVDDPRLERPGWSADWARGLCTEE